MGRFSDTLSGRIRARRVAEDITHPAGYRGMVMWCPRCSLEIMRSKARRAVPLKIQQAAVDAHDRVCKLRHVKSTFPHRVQLEHRRIVRRAWLYRRLWWLVALVTGALVWLVLR